MPVGPVHAYYIVGFGRTRKIECEHYQQTNHIHIKQLFVYTTAGFKPESSNTNLTVIIKISIEHKTKRMKCSGRFIIILIWNGKISSSVSCPVYHKILY